MRVIVEPPVGATQVTFAVPNEVPPTAATDVGAPLADTTIVTTCFEVPPRFSELKVMRYTPAGALVSRVSVPLAPDATKLKPPGRTCAEPPGAVYVPEYVDDICGVGVPAETIVTLAPMPCTAL